ncbi:MAG: membrane dipeptidase [Clostridia bacterium]|nr:membrane dipeptidase [Clostridia bacterium]
MKFFDLHCDTLYRAYNENKSIYKNNDFHISYEKSKRFKKYVQCFAAWIPDEYRGVNALNLFDGCIDKLQDEKKESKFNIIKTFDDFDGERCAVVTVEGGAVLGGDIQKVRYLSENNVKIMTLTWNGRCEIGDGCGEINSQGITEFGKQVVKEMESYGIIIDVSHASEKLFFDVANIAKKPFIATHSNSYSVCPHKRNLTDSQFLEIKNGEGIVGITFCSEFLNSNKNAGLDDILKHAEHFWGLGGEDVTCIGSDFDGAEVPPEINSLEKVENLYEYFLKKNYKESLVQKLFFENAYEFMKLHIK